MNKKKQLVGRKLKKVASQSEEKMILSSSSSVRPGAIYTLINGNTFGSFFAFNGFF